MPNAFTDFFQNQWQNALGNNPERSTTANWANRYATYGGAAGPAGTAAGALLGGILGWNAQRKATNKANNWLNSNGGVPVDLGGTGAGTATPAAGAVRVTPSYAPSYNPLVANSPLQSSGNAGPSQASAIDDALAAIGPYTSLGSGSIMNNTPSIRPNLGSYSSSPTYGGTTSAGAFTQLTGAARGASASDGLSYLSENGMGGGTIFNGQGGDSSALGSFASAMGLMRLREAASNGDVNAQRMLAETAAQRRSGLLQGGR